jgi:hypothetical protein
LESLKKRDNLRDLAVDERITLKCCVIAGPGYAAVALSFVHNIELSCSINAGSF